MILLFPSNFLLRFLFYSRCCDGCNILSTNPVGEYLSFSLYDIRNDNIISQVVMKKGRNKQWILKKKKKKNKEEEQELGSYGIHQILPPKQIARIKLTLISQNPYRSSRNKNGFLTPPWLSISPAQTLQLTGFNLSAPRTKPVDTTSTDTNASTTISAGIVDPHIVDVFDGEDDGDGDDGTREETIPTLLLYNEVYSCAE